MNVAITPSAKASTPCPIHTGCTREAPWASGEADESKGVADVVVVITV
jgi:hypothetical protein